ncbi:hypothetical protein [Priestia megaterium]|uniref:hypothetical protein n=1 Tax=Priestia megaterium TaxID=1404 RepID=UPI0015E2DD9C|nr:hypothetical protein [Priestia megaterium]
MEIKSYKQYEEVTVEYEKGESKVDREKMEDSGWVVTNIDTESPFKGDRTTYTYRKEI